MSICMYVLNQVMLLLHCDALAVITLSSHLTFSLFILQCLILFSLSLFVCPQSLTACLWTGTFGKEGDTLKTHMQSQMRCRNAEAGCQRMFHCEVCMSILAAIVVPFILIADRPFVCLESIPVATNVESLSD